jgi:hypothetical protein
MLRVALLVPDGFATLSFAPLAAFEAANLVLGERFYDVHVTSVAGGRVANSFGMEVDTECVMDSGFDTLLVGSDRISGAAPWTRSRRRRHANAATHHRTPAALMHILMGDPLTPREAERKGLVHETVSGKALDRAMQIARRLSSFTPESVAYIKCLVRNATEMPLAEGLALERNLFLKLCISEPALARLRSYEEENITSPSRSFVVEGD